MFGYAHGKTWDPGSLRQQVDSRPPRPLPRTHWTGTRITFAQFSADQVVISCNCTMCKNDLWNSCYICTCLSSVNFHLIEFVMGYLLLYFQHAKKFYGCKMLRKSLQMYLHMLYIIVSWIIKSYQSWVSKINTQIDTSLGHAQSETKLNLVFIGAVDQCDAKKYVRICETNWLRTPP